MYDDNKTLGGEEPDDNDEYSSSDDEDDQVTNTSEHRADAAEGARLAATRRPGMRSRSTTTSAAAERGLKRLRPGGRPIVNWAKKKIEYINEGTSLWSLKAVVYRVDVGSVSGATCEISCLLVRVDETRGWLRVD